MTNVERPDRAEAELLDRTAIRATLEAYFSSVDRRDWRAYGECFAEDARVEFNHGEAQVVVGRETIVRRAEQRPDRPISNHLISNTHIEVEGDRATAVTHGIAHLVVAKDGGTRIVVRGLVYEDEFVADVDRVWRIARRSHRPTWQYDAPAMPLGY